MFSVSDKSFTILFTVSVFKIFIYNVFMNYDCNISTYHYIIFSVQQNVLESVFLAAVCKFKHDD